MRLGDISFLGHEFAYMLMLAVVIYRFQFSKHRLAPLSKYPW